MGVKLVYQYKQNETWTFRPTDTEWLERNKAAVHSSHKTREEAERASRQIWTEREPYPYIDEFMVIVSNQGEYQYEQRYCILVSNPDIIMG